VAGFDALAVGDLLSARVADKRGGQDGESAWTEFWSGVEFAVGLSDDQIVVSMGFADGKCRAEADPGCQLHFGTFITKKNFTLLRVFCSKELYGTQILFLPS
jgi:hypothetical protein